MLKRFGLFGPPGIILFDRAGKEITDGRVIGYQDSQKFLASLGKLQ
jgi:thiol:disulfide interchange protein DsbD